jgi:hypothetical protein
MHKKIMIFSLIAAILNVFDGAYEASTLHRVLVGTDIIIYIMMYFHVLATGIINEVLWFLQTMRVNEVLVFTSVMFLEYMYFVVPAIMEQWKLLEPDNEHIGEFSIARFSRIYVAGCIVVITSDGLRSIVARLRHVTGW